MVAFFSTKCMANDDFSEGRSCAIGGGIMRDSGEVVCDRGEVVCDRGRPCVIGGRPCVIVRRSCVIGRRSCVIGRNKIPFLSFAEFWVRVTSGPGFSLGRIFGGLSIEPWGGGG